MYICTQYLVHPDHCSHCVAYISNFSPCHRMPLVHHSANRGIDPFCGLRFGSHRCRTDSCQRTSEGHPKSSLLGCPRQPWPTKHIKNALHCLKSIWNLTRSINIRTTIKLSCLCHKDTLNDFKCLSCHAMFARKLTWLRLWGHPTRRSCRMCSAESTSFSAPAAASPAALKSREKPSKQGPIAVGSQGSTIAICWVHRLLAPPSNFRRLWNSTKTHENIQKTMAKSTCLPDDTWMETETLRQNAGLLCIPCSSEWYLRISYDMDAYTVLYTVISGNMSW